MADPCGSIGKYFPTGSFYLIPDKFKLYRGSVSSGNEISIDPTNIASPADKKYRFKNNGKNQQYLNKEDERLMVWYQMETFPDFVKLWGHIDQDLPAGTYYIEITDYGRSSTQF